MKVVFFLRRGFAVLATCLVLAGCGVEDADGQTSAQQQQAGQPTPTLVSVVEVTPETVPVETELPGRVAPMTTSEIRPRITGLVLKRTFEQGASVKEGDLLYLIDPEPFKATVEAAKATLDFAIAAQQLAGQKAERQIQLQNRGVSSAEESETAVSQRAQADADVLRARAQLKTAELDLQYTEVRAPISGNIGRALITEGSLVSSSSDPMAIIQQIDPIYADFTQPADTLITIRNALKQGDLKGDPEGNVILRLVSEQGKQFPLPGKLLFSEASVNAQTGQLILRAEFPNPDRNLLPGMYVRTKLQQGALENAFAVPEQAVQRDTSGKPQLYVVNSQGTVEISNVTLGWIVDGRWVVLKGLNDKDRVIVEGFQKIAPGLPVKAEPWTDPSTKSDAATAENER